MKLNKIILLLLIFTTNTFAFNLVGTWKLISLDDQQSKTHHFHCYHPTGFLIYTAENYMAAGVNCMKSASSSEPSFVPQYVTFYLGKYQLNGNKITHYVRNSSDAEYYGKSLEREIQVLNDDEIMLVVKTKNNDLVRLKWERIQPSQTSSG